MTYSAEIELGKDAEKLAFGVGFRIQLLVSARADITVSPTGTTIEDVLNEKTSQLAVGSTDSDKVGV